MKTSDANYGNKKTGESIPSLKPIAPKPAQTLALCLIFWCLAEKTHKNQCFS